jgi:membrane protease YdiL (CAAX protease family)
LYTDERQLASGVSLTTLVIAWGITIALAISPNVVEPGTHSAAQWALFVGLLSPVVLPFVWTPAGSLRTYAGILALLTLLAAFFWNALPAWASHQPWFPDPAGYAAAFIVQSPKVVAAFVLMAVLASLGYSRQEFFLSSGVPRNIWIGLGAGGALVIGLTMLLYMETASLAKLQGAPGAVHYLPLALVLAAMNSFAEEMLYRGVLLGPLLRQVTANQAISMTAALFGIAHFHGTPSGFPGMGLTFIAGWIFGWAMVETRSILLPWFLHFVPDSVIFVASALQNPPVATHA